MRAFTRLTLTTTAVVLALAALPTAYVLNGPKWGTRTVNYYINPANNDVSEAAAEAAIQVGAATWGSQSAADFRFYYMGRTNGTAAMNNGKNEVFFRNVASGSTVAETYWWSDAGGHVIDADIMFYDGGMTFFTGSSGCSGGVFVEDTVAHEFGHALGLGHSSDPDATMYYVTNWCSTSGRSLAPDDLAGVEALYPASSASRNAAPSVSLTSPADGSTYSAPASLTVTANASDSDGTVARVDFLANGSVVASDRTSPYNASLSNLAAGTYVLTAVATDDAGATATASARTIVVNATVTGTRGTAAYVTTDASTQGTWKGVYGADGYAIAADATSLPGDMQLGVTGQSSWTWAGSTTDGRAMQRAASDRVMAAWYGSNFTIDVNVTGSQPRQLAVYSADYDGGGRQQQFDLVDASTGAVLDTRTLTAFTTGQYLVWAVQGHVQIRVTRLAGANAVVSGILIGGGGAAAGPPNATSVTFRATDAVTQGTWKGVYGSGGYSISDDASSLSSFLKLLWSGFNSWTWASASADVRALERSTTGRVMAASYGTAFSIDVNLTDGADHQIAVYSADYDNGGRRQRFDVVDATTGVVLDSRTISAFTGGVYEVWTVRGHVVIKVVSVAGPNAVVSGLFVD